MTDVQSWSGSAAGVAWKALALHSREEFKDLSQEFMINFFLPAFQGFWLDMTTE